MVKPGVSVSQINPCTQQGTYHAVSPPRVFAGNGQAFLYSQLPRPTTCVKEAARHCSTYRLLTSDLVPPSRPSLGHTLKNTPLDPNCFQNCSFYYF